MDLNKLEEEFKNLSSEDQWRWILLHGRGQGHFFLDNDNTSFHFNVDTEYNHGFYFKNWLGNGPGVDELLIALGFEAQFA